MYSRQEGIDLINGIRAFVKDTAKRFLASSTMQERSKKFPAMKQEVNAQQKKTMLAP